MGFEKMSFGSAPEEPNEQEMRAEMAEESPERALVAEITTAETSYALEGAISKINNLEAESRLNQDQIDKLKDEVNKKQRTLLEDTLSAHSGENGYEFNAPSDLERVQKLITMNPNIEGVDKEQYESLWQEKLEPRAVEMFSEWIGKNDLPSKLESLRERIEGYPFTDEGKRAELFTALDIRSGEVFQEWIGKNDLPSKLESLRERIEGYPFTDEGKRAELFTALDIRSGEVFQEWIGKNDLPSKLESLRERIEGYPFTDEGKRAELFTALDIRSGEVFQEWIGKNDLPSKLESLRERIEGYPFTDEGKRAELTSLINDKLSGLRAA